MDGNIISKSIPKLRSKQNNVWVIVVTKMENRNWLRGALSFVIFMLFPFTSFSQEEEILVIEAEPAFDISSVKAPSKLRSERPLFVLPSRKIPKTLYQLLPSLDSIAIGDVFDSITTPTAFSFMPVGEEFKQIIAIKRTNDWLLLDWALFTLAAPAGLKMSWININNKGSLELMLSLDRTGGNSNMEQILGTYVDPYTGLEHRSESHWSKAKGFCLIDVDAIAFLADNVFTGYEYSYSLHEYVKDAANNIVGLKNMKKKSIEVWYDFTVLEGQSAIKVQRKTCQEKVIFDPTIDYYKEKETTNNLGAKSIKKLPSCTPMYKEGIYRLKNSQFVNK